MPLSQGYVIRAPDTTGDQIKTYQDGSLHIQTVLIADDSGSPMGVGSNPLLAKGLTEPKLLSALLTLSERNSCLALQSPECS